MSSVSISDGVSSSNSTNILNNNAPMVSNMNLGYVNNTVNLMVDIPSRVGNGSGIQ